MRARLPDGGLRRAGSSRIPARRFLSPVRRAPREERSRRTAMSMVPGKRLRTNRRRGPQCDGAAVDRGLYRGAKHEQGATRGAGRSPHHGHRVEDRGRRRRPGRGGRHGRDPRVDEDGDAVEAEDDGTVAEILVEEGQAVSEGDVLVVLSYGRVALDSPGGRRRAGDDLQPGQAQRARPRAARRAGGGAARARRPLRDPHRRGRRLLRRLRHRRPRRRSGWPRRPRSCSRTRSRRRWRRSTRCRCRSWPRWAATPSAAGWSSRWPATCASARRGARLGCRRRASASSTRTPGCGASSTRSAPPARASCSSPRGRWTRPRRWPGAS